MVCRGLKRISVISCSGKNVTGSFPGVSFMTIIGPWRIEASACMYVPGYWKWQFLAVNSIAFSSSSTMSLGLSICMRAYVRASAVARSRNSSLFAR